MRPSFFRQPSTYRNVQRLIRRDSENVSQLRFDFPRVSCNFSRGVERSIFGAEEKSLLASLRPLATSKQPIKASRLGFPKARWVKSRVLAEAEFEERPPKGFCHPSFKGIRRDLT